MEDVVALYASGFASGVVLSVLPFVVGKLVHFSLSIMRKGG